MSSLFPASARELWLRTRARAGRERVSIGELARPLRADLIAQRDFLALCAAQLERGGACDESLTGAARSTPYWLWFSEVHLPRTAPRLANDPVARGRAFGERVRASFELVRDFRERGPDAREPIVLHAAGDRLHAPEDGHAIALLWQAGQAELEPAQYRVRRARSFEPFDCTAKLKDALARLRETDPERADQLASRLQLDLR